MNVLLIFFGKLLSLIIRYLNVGSGSTWPGHIALSLNSNFIKDILKNSKIKIILIAGTNGKTTTGKLIENILRTDGKKVFQNQAGANLLNGIVSSLIQNSNLSGKMDFDFAIFEIDENTLPLILKEINNPHYIILLNLFRDQLDRYGEVNTIVKKWNDAMKNLSDKTTLILNADDPQIASIGNFAKAKVFYFGLKTENNKKIQHASDSTYCPNCGKKLFYNFVSYSHLGNWTCKTCSFKYPQKVFYDSPIYPLAGIYNKYNVNASVLFAKINNTSDLRALESLKNFKPAFGRQEILNIDRKKVQIFLSKNPTSFNESLRTISSLNAKNVLIVLNDRIPDGRDVSWIWDVDTEEYVENFNKIIVSGDRALDMGLRLKYSSEFQISDFKFQIEGNLEKAIALSLQKTSQSETLYILPTYSAMLEVRKILTGKKIL